MIYIKSLAGGIVASALSLILLILIMTVWFRPQGNHDQGGEVSLILTAPLPLTVMLIAFAAGFYLVFRISK